MLYHKNQLFTRRRLEILSLYLHGAFGSRMGGPKASKHQTHLNYTEKCNCSQLVKLIKLYVMSENILKNCNNGSGKIQITFYPSLEEKMLLFATISTSSVEEVMQLIGIDSF